MLYLCDLPQICRSPYVCNLRYIFGRNVASDFYPVFHLIGVKILVSNIFLGYVVNIKSLVPSTMTFVRCEFPREMSRLFDTVEIIVWK